MARKFARLDKSTEVEPLPDGWRFNLPEQYVYETVAEYLRNGTLPCAGGWDDQLVEWKEDLYMMMHVMAWEGYVTQVVDDLPGMENLT